MAPVTLFLLDLTTACGDPPGLVCRWVYQATGRETLAGFADWFVARPMKVLVILVAAFVANRLIRRLIRRSTTKINEDRERRIREREADLSDDGRVDSLRERAAARVEFLRMQTDRSRQRTEALGAVLRSTSSLVVYGVAAMMILAEFGVSLGPLLAGAGIAGVALGFGAQSLVKDFLSGMFMLLEDQFGIGDVIDVGDATGTVEEIRLRSTRLRDVEGTVWHIPNGEIRRIGNKSQQWARAVMDVEIAYDTDIDLAIRVIKEVADSVWRDRLEEATVLEEPEVWGVQGFGESAMKIRLVLTVEPGKQWNTARVVRRRLKSAFDEAGIEIPFPQRVVWLRSAEPPSETP